MKLTFAKDALLSLISGSSCLTKMEQHYSLVSVIRRLALPCMKVEMSVTCENILFPQCIWSVMLLFGHLSLIKKNNFVH